MVKFKDKFQIISLGLTIFKSTLLLLKSQSYYYYFLAQKIGKNKGRLMKTFLSLNNMGDKL